MSTHKTSPDNGVTRYPHPFQYWDSLEICEDDDSLCGIEPPKTIFELKMWALSSAIREKSYWWEKVDHDMTMEKWKQEALEQQKGLPKARALTERMIDYTLGELFAHARIRKRNDGIELGPYDRIWKSDTLIPEELRQELLIAVAPLENVSDAQKDWRPGSDGQRFDLVHPSLYPVVYGRTLEGKNVLGVIRVPLATDEARSEYFTSQKFQWLASDFSVSERGEVRLDSPYINNINPVTGLELYKVVPKVLKYAVPMFENVLSDLRRRLSPSRLEHDRGRCIWGAGGAYDRPNQPGSVELPNYFPPGYDSEEGDGFQEAIEGYWFDQTMYLPDACEEYNVWLDEVHRTVSLRGTRLQVIIKLVNVVLTPEKPRYPGGEWHVEGMENETIVANFIYYYESENISESRLAFKLSVSEPNTHGPDDFFCTEALYGIDEEDPLAQEVGSVPTKGGRCLAFPNLYQHQVRPFHLEDPTRPGVQKIFMVCLCDPNLDIISTSRVTPQQREWVQEAVCNPEEGSLFRKLPRELLDLIVENVDGLMSRKEAEGFREKLMRERTAFVDRHSTDFFGVEFSM